MDRNNIVKTVSNWVESIVIELNLCPFAKREVVKNRVRYALSEATDQQTLLHDLEAELQLLTSDSSIETSLLIHPDVLQDFYQYNQFLDTANRLLVQLDREGIIQIASFHPDYQFAETQPDDVENYTNRSPYPILHLIREDSLETAIANYPEPETIPENNIERMENMGLEKMKALLQACFAK